VTDEQPLVVLVVSYRRADLLRRCLDSVHKHLGGTRVLVWDNRSEGSPEIRRLAGEYPTVEWTFAEENVGYAKAINGLAARVAGADMLLLNPDAELTGPLARSRAAVREPRVAAVSPRVVDPQGGPDWDVARRKQTVVRSLVSHSGYGKRLRGKRISDYYRQPPAEVDGYLSGCCLLISGDAWRELGGFDEKFFLYGEESEWQGRAKAGGWRLVLADEHDVTHAAAGTTAGDPLAERRSRDLLRAGQAEMLGMSNYGPGTIFIAGLAVLDRVQRSHRGVRQREKAKVTTSHPSILLTSNELCQGGAERQRVLLANELAKRGYPVTIACLQHFGPLTPELDPAVRLVLTPWWQPLVDLPTDDAVLITGVTNTEAGFAMGWRAANTARKGRHRWLAATHEPAAPQGPTYSNKLAKTIARSDGVIALSPRHWTDITRHQSLHTKHFIAPNGVPAQQDRGYRPGSPLRLGMLCRMVEHKNPHMLVAALDTIEGSSWTLDLFGDGPDRARLEALTPERRQGQIRWHGASPGPDHAFSEIDVLCVPSRAEAFPLVIVEAMARGVPVLSSSVGSVPDLLDNGRAGVLIEPVTVEAWATALRPIIDEPNRLTGLATAGARRAAELYTVDAMTDAYETAITAAL
jgi:GT2 family glycosyltransferase/glycosyltransferase involved in cell wall biosynthesis